MEEREWEDLYSFFSSLSAKTSILKESIINIYDDYLFGFKDIFQNPNQANTAEIVETFNSVYLNRLRWSKFERQLVLTSHSAGVFKITKN